MSDAAGGSEPANRTGCSPRRDPRLPAAFGDRGGCAGGGPGRRGRDPGRERDRPGADAATPAAPSGVPPVRAAQPRAPAAAGTGPPDRGRGPLDRGRPDRADALDRPPPLPEGGRLAVGPAPRRRRPGHLDGRLCRPPPGVPADLRLAINRLAAEGFARRGLPGESGLPARLPADVAAILGHYAEVRL